MNYLEKYRIFRGTQWCQEVWEGGITERESVEFLEEDAQYVVIVRADANPTDVASHLRSLAGDIESDSLADALRVALPESFPSSPQRTRENGKLRTVPPD